MKYIRFWDIFHEFNLIIVKHHKNKTVHWEEERKNRCWSNEPCSGQHECCDHKNRCMGNNLCSVNINMELRNQTTLNEPCPWNLKHLLWKSLMKLTLPSETHTSWFCCCWMVSFNAPYQPSFMLFMLMVARGQSQEGRHQITQENPAMSARFL